VLEGAFFADAGNIWNIQSDPARPGADFSGRRFISEIALGVGTGFRFNFDFFLIRLDLGLQLRDPSLDPGERWLFQPKTLYNEYIDALNLNRPNRPLSYYNWRWNLNLGIGYPF
jgi:outer membrane protein insertion porin family